MKRYSMKVILFMAISCLLTMSLLIGCSSNSNSSSIISSDGFGSVESESLDMIYETTEMVSEPEAMKDMASGNTASLDTDVSMNRKIIKTGTLDIQTETFDKTIENINAQVKSIGGFIQSAHTYGGHYEGNYGNRSGSLTLRIPVDKFDSFMNNTKDYGFVVNKSITNEDITAVYVDNELRLETLLIQKDRLQELLQQAGELSDLFAIERELADVTYEIEKIKGTLNQYDSLIDYATIEMYIQEILEYEDVEQPPITLLEKIESQFNRSLKGLGNFLEWCIVMGVALIPFLVLGGIVGGILLLVVKQILKVKKQKNTKSHNPKEKE